jgi:3-polyprenyl-4-hydroxybenzoate decarboxylase
MPFKDFRAWIRRLDEEDELLHFKDQVKLEPDIGASSQATVLNNGPGLFFENLQGYPPSHPLTIALMGSPRRLALSYRFQADRDLVIIPNYSSVGFDPSESRDGLVTLCGFDATKPKPPSPRYEMVGWVEPWKETEQWRKRIDETWGRREK